MRSIASAKSVVAPAPANRWAVRAMTVLVFAATWVFRWLTIDFTNDHFVHLSRARQILLGEIPVRDFFDPGLPLHYYASAAALMAFGQNLLGEAILTVTFVALGAALTFYLAVRTSRSVLLALIATMVAVVLFPRLYNYPKIFLYPLALVAIAHYAARRNTTAIVVLGMITAVAALFRLDHGLYVGIAVTAGLVLTNGDQPRNAANAFLRYAAVVGVLLLPFVVFVQVTTGVPSFLAEIRQQRAAVAGARILSIPFSVDRALPMVVVDPPSPGLGVVHRRRTQCLLDGGGEGHPVHGAPPVRSCFPVQRHVRSCRAAEAEVPDTPDDRPARPRDPAAVRRRARHDG